MASIPVAFMGFVLATAASATQEPVPLEDPPPDVATGQVAADPDRTKAQDPVPPVPETPVPETPGPETPGQETPGAEVPDPGATGPASVAPAPTPVEPFAAYEARYHDLAEVRELLDRWASNAPCAVEPVVLTAEGQALDVPAIQWGTAGPVPLSERPTVFLIGGLDGISVAGGEAVLSVTAALFAKPPRDDLAFVSIPWASVDALADAALDGRSRVPADDDGDGALDEDGPDDADNDGSVLEMLIEDPEGPWTFSSDPRFLAPARPGDSPRFRHVREGKDDDGDGRYNEDAAGGTCLDRNFPVGWPGSWTDPACGAYPLSEPIARALADLVLARRTVGVLLFQGNHGSLAGPGGFVPTPWPAGADVLDFELVTAEFARATGRVQGTTLELARARGRAAPGAALDWLYAVPGALALELGVWGPDVEAPAEPGDVVLSNALYASARPTPLGAGTPPSALDLAWARWLDNTRGGIGFEPWRPVTLGDGTPVRVGGWSPFTLLNPPEDSLPRALEGLPAFVRGFATALPRLELVVGPVVREGEICRIRARVTNHGTLSSGLWTTGRRPGTPADLIGSGCLVELALPPGAQLLAGEARSALGRLPGGASSHELSWVVLAAPGSVVSITAESAWCLTQVREVQP